MNCKETNRAIARFLEERLDDKELEAFIEHIEECEVCYEELSIQYLVGEGMERLENGGDFDLGAELQNKIEAAKKKLKIAYLLRKAALFLGAVLCVCILIFFLVMVLT